MAGLNVKVAPYVPPRDLPADIVYKPVDLSAFLNRGFKDDVGDDGKGGWPDQGPKADMHDFPTGDQNFGGVPFHIGKEPRTCIVLKSNSRPLPELYPDEATIPLGYPVEGLCFLHSTSWGAQARRESTISSTRMGHRPRSSWSRTKTFSAGRGCRRSFRGSEALAAAWPGRERR